MDLVTADLTAKLSEYLARRSVPRSMADNEAAQKGELSSLVRTLRKYVEADNVPGWWDRLQSVLAETSETRAWPTAFEIKKAALAIGSSSPKRPVEKGDLDPLAIASRRIKAGEPVGDGYLWGRLAKQLVEKRLVSDGELNVYRNRMERTIREMYTDDVGNRMIAGFHAKHEAAQP